MQRKAWMSRFATVIACVAAVAAVGAVMRTDLLLGQGLGKALQQSRPGLSFDGGQSAASNGPVVGDEGYWLTRVSASTSTLFAKPLLVGDKITISGSDGRDRQLEVTALKALGTDPAARPGGNLAHARLMLVICRILDGAGQNERQVRFIIEAEPAESVTPAPAKAL